MIDHIDGLAGIIEKQVIDMLNNEAPAFCKSFYDEDNILRNCTCGKCIEEDKAQLEQGDRDMQDEIDQEERDSERAESQMYALYE